MEKGFKDTTFKNFFSDTLLMFVSLKFIHVEILTHKVMELGGRAFGR